MSHRASLLRFSAAALLVTSMPTVAWDGTTSEGGAITVESYDHGGRGEGQVEYYDHESGEYRSGYMDMHVGGSGEITDDETGETIEVDMD